MEQQLITPMAGLIALVLLELVQPAIELLVSIERYQVPLHCDVLLLALRAVVSVRLLL